MNPADYDFPINRATMEVDSRTPQELAKYIDDHAADRLTNWEAQFIEDLMKQGDAWREWMTPGRFKSLVKIYDERV
jgi:muconolactone delta-isomerase